MPPSLPLSLRPQFSAISLQPLARPLWFALYFRFFFRSIFFPSPISSSSFSSPPREWLTAETRSLEHRHFIRAEYHFRECSYGVLLLFFFFSLDIVIFVSKYFLITLLSSVIDFFSCPRKLLIVAYPSLSFDYDCYSDIDARVYFLARVRANICVDLGGDAISWNLK